MVLYEMLTGRPPFAGSSPIAIATSQMTEMPPPPSTINPLVPRSLDAMVMRAMSIDPQDRQPTADDLRIELLAGAPAAGDPDATMAIGAPAGARSEATSVIRSVSSTSVLPPVTARPAMRRAGPEEFRRRRMATILVVAVVAVAAIGLIALLSGGSKTGAATVPNVIGLTVAEGRAALDRAGLRTTLDEQDRTGAPVDRVIDQNPKAGARVGSGSAVSLIVPRIGASTSSTRPSTTTTPSTQPVQTTQPPQTGTTVAPTTVATTTPATTVRPSTTVARTTVVSITSN